MQDFYQSESAECGLVCVAIVLETMGSATDLRELRQRHYVSSRGTSLRELAEIASANALSSRAIRCDLHELANLKCPAILHWGLQHYVVLNRVKGKFISITDPALGLRKLLIDEVSRHFSGVALELSPAPDFKRKTKKSELSLFSWFRMNSAMRGSLAQVLLLSLVLQLYVIAIPFYVQLSVDQAALKGDRQLLISLAVGFGLLGLLQVGASAIRSVIVLRLSSLVNWDMTVRLFHHLIRLPLPWFQRRKLADTISRFDSISAIRDLITGGFVTALVDGFLAITTVLMMFLFSPQLALLAIFFGVIKSSVRLGSLPLLIRLGMDTLRARISENGKRIETIRAIQTLKIMAGESRRESDWANKFAQTVKKEQSQQLANIGFSSVGTAIDILANVILVYVASNSIIGGSSTVGGLFAFMSYHIQFSASLSAFLEQLIHWRLTDMYSNRLADIVLTPKEIGIDESRTENVEIKGAIQFVNVGFAYSKNEIPVLRDVSVSIGCGELVAIVGASGAGKSTFLKILCGLYPTSYGEVRLDGLSLESWGPVLSRRAFGVVMQDDELLAGTIAENISFFDESINLDKVWSCLESACISDDVLKMPMRLQTQVAESGANFSGGQKQRFLLARALYRNPRILILDEATSHLDVLRESAINKSLSRLTITRVVVAHRRETIDAAERVITLRDGVIISDKRKESTAKMIN